MTTDIRHAVQALQGALPDLQVLAEEHERRDALVDDVKNLKAQISGLTAEVVRLNAQRVAAATAAQGDVAKREEAAKRTEAAAAGRLEDLQRQLQPLRDQGDVLRAKLEQQGKQHAGAEAAHRGRLQALEGLIAAAEGRLAKTQAAITALHANLSKVGA